MCSITTAWNNRPKYKRTSDCFTDSKNQRYFPPSMALLNNNGNNTFPKHPHLNPDFHRGPPKVGRRQDILLCFHLITAGEQGENLGQDEAPIVQISFTICELPSGRVLDVRKFDVRPASPFYENLAESGIAAISDEVKSQYNLSQEKVEMHKFLLAPVLNEINNYLKARGFHPEVNGGRLCLVTEGPLYLRAVLHPEAYSNQINLQPYFFSYYDILKEATKGRQPLSNPLKNIDDVMKYLCIEPISVADKSMRPCQNIASIVLALTSNGHKWEGPERIEYNYRPAVIKRTDSLEEDTSVKCRGLPWSATIMDVRQYFRGVNIAPGGVALVLSKNGRRNGEALIRLADKEQRRIALLRNRHHLGRRVVEVVPVSNEEFLTAAGSDCEEGESFLSQITSSNQTVVRMRGLPYDASYENIASFFATVSCEVQYKEKGVLFVNHPDGRSTGDAFVIFEDEDTADRALSIHKQHIGERYVELFKSTPSEVNQVLHAVKHNEVEKKSQSENNQSNSASANRLANSVRLPGLPILPAGLNLGLSNNTGLALNPALALMRSNQGLPTPLTYPGLNLPAQALTAGSMPLVSSPFLTAGNPLLKASIVIKGALPETTESDVLNFLGNHRVNVLPTGGVQFAYNALGQWTGSTVVTFLTEASAFLAAQQKNGQTLLSSSTGKEAIVKVNYIGDINALIASSSQIIKSAQLSSANQLPVNQCSSVPMAFSGSGLPIVSSLNTLTPNYFYPNYLNVGLPVVSNASANLATMTTSTRLPASSSGLLQTANFALQRNGVNPAQGLFASNLPAVSPSSDTSLPTVSPNCYQLPNLSLQAVVSSQMDLSSVVIAKGLPKDANYAEIMGLFLNALPATSILDIKLSVSTDGTSTGDAFIIFNSKSEAELAVSHCNKKTVRDKSVDLYIAQANSKEHS